MSDTSDLMDITDFYMNDMEKKFQMVTNLADVPNSENTELPIIHLIWIGQIDMSKVTEVPYDSFTTYPPMVFVNSMGGLAKFEAIIYYWVDYELTDYTPLQKFFDDYPNKNVKIYLKNVRDLEKFSFINSTEVPIYEYLLDKKLFNYAKELLSLMCLYEYGGYFFDTTTELDFFKKIDKGEGNSTLHPLHRENIHDRLYSKICPVFIGFRYDDAASVFETYNGQSNVLLDVFFYYSPMRDKIIRLLIMNMINNYALFLKEGIGQNILFPISRPLTFSQFLSLPYIVEYTDDPEFNNYLMLLTYMSAYGINNSGPICNFYRRPDGFSLGSILVRHLRCFLVNLYFNQKPQETEDRFFDNFMILTSRFAEPKISITHMQDQLYLIKTFGMSGWKKNMGGLYY